jgi:hypothetical protein
MRHFGVESSKIDTHTDGKSCSVLEMRMWMAENERPNSRAAV